MARYKHSVCYMTPGRFLLFLIVMCDSRNSSKIKSGKFAKHASAAVASELERKGAAATCTGRCCPTAAAAAGSS